MQAGFLNEPSALSFVVEVKEGPSKRNDWLLVSHRTPPQSHYDVRFVTGTVAISLQYFQF